jgi:hypothetical protein
MNTEIDRAAILLIVSEHRQIPIRDLARLLARPTRAVGLDVEVLRRQGRVSVIRPEGGYRAGERIVCALETPC